jgi:hypothetical protein
MSDTPTPAQLAYEAWVRSKESPPPPTPGQVAYEAYWGARYYPTRRCWQDLRPAEQQRWEAAAAAVLAQCTPQEERR